MTLQRAIEFGGMALGETRYAPRQTLRREARQPAFFRLLLAGALTESSGPQPAVYRPFTLAFQPAGAHEAETGEDGAHCFTVEIGGAWLDRAPGLEAQARPLADLHAGELLWHSVQLYREYTRLPNPFSQITAEGIVLEMLAALARALCKKPLRQPAWLARSVAVLHADFARCAGLEPLAAIAGVHPVHFSRVFRRHYQCTLSEYLRRLRLQYACQRLVSNPGGSLAEVAAASGFADQSHLTHLFREFAGMTPGALRACLPGRGGFPEGALCA